MGETVVTAQARIETVSISAPDPGVVAFTWGQPVAGEDCDTAEFTTRRCLVDLAPGVVLRLDTRLDDPAYVRDKPLSSFCCPSTVMPACRTADLLWLTPGRRGSTIWFASGVEVS
ncbi:hypothetical protein GCM10009799_23760 [Nocardiopsis rhodophaea]|uniref:Uncharacterized protein n=1 Tax=Nocardiopsis rhodophaea TaxID=280238 RepID=A0ABP5EJ47_9ACTN